MCLVPADLVHIGPFIFGSGHKAISGKGLQGVPKQTKTISAPPAAHAPATGSYGAPLPHRRTPSAPIPDPSPIPKRRGIAAVRVAFTQSTETQRFRSVPCFPLEKIKVSCGRFPMFWCRQAPELNPTCSA